MDKKEQFKTFARENPEFSEHVNKGDISWQQLYEMYDLYGKDSKVWDKYKKSNSVDFSKIKDTIKNMDVNKLEESINNAKKSLEIISALVGTKASNVVNNTSNPSKASDINKVFGEE